jgi:hypothetical protein
MLQDANDLERGLQRGVCPELARAETSISGTVIAMDENVFRTWTEVCFTTPLCMDMVDMKPS